MDGARLWNAVAASGRSGAEIVAPVDSVMFCFSKGLGAPVGSILVGSSEFIARARTLRSRLGGSMRQAGVIAAAAKVAFDGRARLVDPPRTPIGLPSGSPRGSPMLWTRLRSRPTWCWYASPDYQVRPISLSRLSRLPGYSPR